MFGYVLGSSFTPCQLVVTIRDIFCILLSRLFSSRRTAHLRSPARNTSTQRLHVVMMSFNGQSELHWTRRAMTCVKP